MRVIAEDFAFYSYPIAPRGSFVYRAIIKLTYSKFRLIEAMVSDNAAMSFFLRR